MLSVIGINIILSVSLNLTNGFTGDFSLGHAAFMSIGAYTAAILTLSPAVKQTMNAGLPAGLQQMTIPFILAIIVGGLLAAVLAVIVGIPVLRLRGHYLAVATLGLMVIVRVVANNWQSVTRGARGINGLPPVHNIWWTYGLAAITIYVVWRLVHSPLWPCHDRHPRRRAVGLCTRRARLPDPTARLHGQRILRRRGRRACGRISSRPSRPVHSRLPSPST